MGTLSMGMLSTRIEHIGYRWGRCGWDAVDEDAFDEWVNRIQAVDGDVVDQDALDERFKSKQAVDGNAVDGNAVDEDALDEPVLKNAVDVNVADGDKQKDRLKTLIYNTFAIQS